MRTALFFVLAFAICGSAAAAPLGETAHREGLAIGAGLESSILLDRMPVAAAPGPDTIFLTADIRADKDEPHGFAEHSFIPYLSVSYSLTKEGAPAFKQAGLLYPAAGRSGPRYVGAVQLAGPGTYSVTYLVSPPSTRGLYRQTDKNGGVPAWWKPMSLSWSFSWPLK